MPAGHSYSYSPRLDTLASPRRTSKPHSTNAHDGGKSLWNFVDPLKPEPAVEEQQLLTWDGARSLVTHQCHGAGAVVATPLMSAGVHTFTYEIHHSASGDGCDDNDDT